MLAVRLLGVSAALLLLPGLLLLCALRVRAEWPHRIVLAFSLSYSWVFVLSIVRRSVAKISVLLNGYC